MLYNVFYTFLKFVTCYPHFVMISGNTIFWPISKKRAQVNESPNHLIKLCSVLPLVGSLSNLSTSSSCIHVSEQER